MKCGVDKFCLGATSACCIHGMHPGTQIMSDVSLCMTSLRVVSTGERKLSKNTFLNFPYPVETARRLVHDSL